MEKKIRVLLLILSFALLSTLLAGVIRKGIEKALAVAGTIQYGSSGSPTISYVTQKSLYTSDVYFGKSNFAGSLTSDGAVVIGSASEPGSTQSRSPAANFLFDLNGYGRANLFSINNTNTSYNLDVTGNTRVSGNVGIGLGSTPTSNIPLTLLQPTPGAAIATLKDNGGNTASLGVGSNVMTLDKGLSQTGAYNSTFVGNAGFNGNTGPAAPLDIGGTTANNVQAIFTRGNGDGSFQVTAQNGTGNTSGSVEGYLGLRYSGTNNTTAGINFHRGGGAVDSYLGFLSNGAERMTLDNTGNLGIGTTTPVAKLSVGTTAANSWNINTSDVTSGAWLRNDGANPVISTNVGNMYYGFSGNAKNLYFMGGGTTPQVTINSSGQMGIGTTPVQLLTVGSAGGAAQSFYNIGTGTLGVGSSIYSYGHICAGNSSGACTGTGGTDINGGTVTSWGNHYAYAYYDQNNTSYYVDPASYSQLNNVGFTSGLTYNTSNYGVGYIYVVYETPAILRHNADAAPPGCVSFFEGMQPGYEGQIVKFVNDPNSTYCGMGNLGAIFVHEATSYVPDVTWRFSMPSGTTLSVYANQEVDFVYHASRWRPLNMYRATTMENMTVGGQLTVNGTGSYNFINGTYTDVNNKLGVGMNPPTYQLDVAGTTRTSGEFIANMSGTAGQMRMISGNYGAFFRNDGSNTYLLLTNSGDQYGSWNGLRPWAVNNASGYVTFGNGHNDLAEKYNISGTVLRGSLVSISDAGKMMAQASDSTHTAVVGVISTIPGAVMDADGGFVIGPPTKLKYTNEKAPVALQGTAPTLVSSVNGTIKIGDAITTSSLPGFGAKATKAGLMVGRALEAFNPASCPAASSLDAITWPTDDSKNSLHPCYQLPDGTYVGKVMIALGPTWSDPDVVLTSTKDLSVTEVSSIGAYQVKTGTGSVIDRVGAFAELVIAKLQAGLIEAKKLVVNGVDVMQKLNDLSATVEKQQQQIGEMQRTIDELKNK